MTDRVTTLLEELHSSLDSTDDDAIDQRMDHLLDVLDEMLDLASLTSLSRVAHGQSALPTPHLEECNTLLERAEVSKIGTCELNALLRFTYRQRDRLPAWRPLAQQAAKELEQRCPDRWRALMHGMLDT